MTYRTKSLQHEPDQPRFPQVDHSRAARRWAVAAVVVAAVNFGLHVGGMVLRHYQPEHWMFREIEWP